MIVTTHIHRDRDAITVSVHRVGAAVAEALRDLLAEPDEHGRPDG